MVKTSQYKCMSRGVLQEWAVVIGGFERTVVKAPHSLPKRHFAALAPNLKYFQPYPFCSSSSSAFSWKNNQRIWYSLDQKAKQQLMLTEWWVMKLKISLWCHSNGVSCWFTVRSMYQMLLFFYKQHPVSSNNMAMVGNTPSYRFKGRCTVCNH